jgi:Domain of unknown function (DUF4878)
MKKKSIKFTVYKTKVMNKTKIFLFYLATWMFVACGGSETEETKQDESTVTDETAPKTEEETTSTEDVVTEEETTSTDEVKTDDEKTGVSRPGNIDQKDPEMVMEGIFMAAESGNYSGLDALCSSDADGDCKMICGIANADAKKKEEFKSYFAKGTVVNTEINGPKATVEFKFGPDGKKDEKMELVLVKGKWYIQSF